MLQGTPSALLTIGSTSFTPLINAILSPTSLSALISIGIKSILLQIGNSTLPSDWNEGSRLYIADADGDGVIRVEVVRFIDELESRVGAFELVISHAGSFRSPSPPAFVSLTMTSDNRSGIHFIIHSTVARSSYHKGATSINLDSKFDSNGLSSSRPGRSILSEGLGESSYSSVG
jgi:hypothetical protein